MNRNSRAFATALVLTTLLGCTTAAKTVATAQNGYDFRIERYLDRCQIVTPPVECAAAKATLDVSLKHLHEAAKALKAGGGFPLQLAAIKADAKALGKMTVTK